jgi:hypothetical protein
MGWHLSNIQLAPQACKGVALSHGAVLTQLHHLATALKVSDTIDI